MKKKMMALVMAVLLVLALTGCGEDKNNTTNGGSSGSGSSGTVQNGGNTGGTDQGNGAANDGAHDTAPGVDDGLTGGDTENGAARSRRSYGTYRGSGDDVFTENRGSTFGRAGEQMQEYDAQWPGTVYDSMTGSQAARGTATWRQMLDNGFVHDTDGFLLDGENACWS